MTALLAPLGAVFGGATALRASLYRRGLLARALIEGNRGALRATVEALAELVA